ncbi:hypothetical protein EDB84DRAFT_1442321 [Lactarius hengduanensis]|nr:hypothetical protein EDB84DRAFT_1442321 [Lactarius hengduanensis]
MQHIETASREDRRILRTNAFDSARTEELEREGVNASFQCATRTWDINVQDRNILYLCPDFRTLVGPNINFPTNVIYTTRKEHDTPNKYYAPRSHTFEQWIVWSGCRVSDLGEIVCWTPSPSKLAPPLNS